MVIERVRQMSVDEFLDFAEGSEERYEFIDGELYPMTPTKYNHNVICYNLMFRLGISLANTDCQVLVTGQGVKAGEGTYLVPDASVVCGEPQTEADTRILLNPIVVVEVISPSSVTHDRILKRDLYESVASIQAYLIVEQDQALAELYTRGESGWQLQTFRGLEDAVPLAALGCRLALRDIYRNINFADGAASAASDVN